MSILKGNVIKLTFKQSFWNAMMKYQTNNPLRKVVNEHAPLAFLSWLIVIFIC